MQAVLSNQAAFAESVKLAAAGAVLVHCLAGAHRAGTTGCLLLMHKGGLGASDAIMAAKRLRPIINPIGSLPGVLKFFAGRRPVPETF